MDKTEASARTQSKTCFWPTITSTMSQQSCERNPSHLTRWVDSGINVFANLSHHKKDFRNACSVMGSKGLQCPHSVMVQKASSSHKEIHLFVKKSTENAHACEKIGCVKMSFLCKESIFVPPNSMSKSFLCLHKIFRLSFIVTCDSGVFLLMTSL